MYTIYAYCIAGKFGSGKIWQWESLAGGKFNKMTRFKHLAKESLAN